MNGCKSLIEAIDKRIELAFKNCKYEYSDSGRVVSIAEDKTTAMVEIRGEIKTCKMNPTCQASPNDIVRVIQLRNDSKTWWIDGGSTSQAINKDIIIGIIKTYLQEPECVEYIKEIIKECHQEIDSIVNRDNVKAIVEEVLQANSNNSNPNP